MAGKILIILLTFSSLIFSKGDFRILSSNSSSILIEYKPVYLDTSFVPIDNEVFRRIEINNGFSNEDITSGFPDIPECRINLGVPSEFGNTVTVISSAFVEKEGKLLPVPEPVKNGNMMTMNYKVNPDYYKYNDYPDLVAFGDFGILRGLNTQTIRILPVKFNPSTNKIRLYTYILFQINYSPVGSNLITIEDELLENSVVNYDVAKSWMKDRKKLAKGIQNSVLANGQWIRFEAPTEGMYKIDRALLQTFGINPAGLDPRTIKIYNNGGKVLPESNLANRPVDLVENAIRIIGEEDGLFDQNDYIIFYGRGTSFRDFDSTSGSILKYNHPYSTKNY
ncbi:MAG TPA: C25 family peptidase propeptide domain-containing protein, partial [Ignavibacteriaceae bacterium]